MLETNVLKYYPKPDIHLFCYLQMRFKGKAQAQLFIDLIIHSIALKNTIVLRIFFVNVKADALRKVKTSE